MLLALCVKILRSSMLQHLAVIYHIVCDVFAGIDDDVKEKKYKV